MEGTCEPYEAHCECEVPSVQTGYTSISGHASTYVSDRAISLRLKSARRVDVFASNEIKASWSIYGEVQGTALSTGSIG